ncbi:MAG: restriction endonuclease subunit S [Desulfuromonadaceae bacterium]
MGGEWQTVRLGDLVSHHKGFAFKSKDYRDSGHPVVRVSNFTGRSIDISGLKYLSENLASQFKDYELKTGDVVIATVGSWPNNPASVVGKAIQVPTYTDSALLNQNAVRLRSRSGLDQRFLFDLLKTADYQNYIVSTAQGSANQASITLNAIFGFEFQLPTLPEQKSIAHILGTLDDKIELNRQMNATLEAMAQALFKSWFVDFDPVIDNALAAGNPIPEPLQARAQKRQALGDKRKPLPQEIQKQFPDRFVFSEEMGWIPEGWEESSVGEQVETTGGGTPSTKEPIYWENGTHAFCTPKDMSLLSSMVLMDTERHLTDAGVNKISSGQLPPGTVLMSSRAPIGYLAISDIPVSVNQGIIGMLPSDKYDSIFLLCWAHFNIGKIEDRANGSTFLEISKKNFRPIPFVVPGDSLLDAFNDQAQAIYDKLLLTAERTESLTRLRDTLLPKLLSGELRIPDAEKILEQAL